MTTVLWLLAGLWTLSKALGHPHLEPKASFDWLVACVGLVLAWPAYWLFVGVGWLIRCIVVR